MELLDKLPTIPVFFVLLAVLGLGPVAAVVVTSFLKIVVVIHLVKNALGLQEVPPNIAINSLALILTFYIMAPVGMSIAENFEKRGVDFNNLNDPNFLTAMTESINPLREFLYKNSTQRERNFFIQTTAQLWPEERAKNVTEQDLIVLVPAFTIGQLRSAFEIGFLLYLPFVVIDLIISNILLALGMIMVSPIVISVPFKLLLFVMLDGWARLLQGLVLSYQ